MWQKAQRRTASGNVCPTLPQAHPKPDMLHVHQYQHHSGQKKHPQKLRRL